MRAPLEHQASVPKNKARQKNAGRGESGAAFSKDARKAVQKNGEPQDKKRGERNKKTVAIRRDPRPIRIRRDEIIKRAGRKQEGSADARYAPPKGHQPDHGEEQNGRPGNHSVI